MGTNRRGFTLIELMIVLAVIAITATLVIANMTTSRIAGNETSAIKGIRSSLEAMTAMRKLLVLDVNANGVGEYPTDMTQMATLAGELLIPMAAAANGANQYHGYAYSVFNDGGTGESAGYVFAAPTTAGVTGNREFAGGTDGRVYGAPVSTGQPGGWLPGVLAAPWTLVQE